MLESLAKQTVFIGAAVSVFKMRHVVPIYPVAQQMMDTDVKGLFFLCFALATGRSALYKHPFNFQPTGEKTL